MKCNYKLQVVLLFLVISCKSISNIEIKKKEHKFDIGFLIPLLTYPDMKISNFNIYDYEYLKKSRDFKILKEDLEGFYLISLSNFNENINHFKELYAYYKKLYNVILAYSSVQGPVFKTEIFNYLKTQGIRKSFLLRLNFINSKKDGNVFLIKKEHLNMLIEDKKLLMVLNQKMEDIVINFLK